ncbi:peptidase [Streptomyces sp. SCSIO ZS0520]|uniref:peptidase n=1 Tax=Streptomyces sp. SCSIO ZS0520 TaxID=2892996 RepID=UPI0021D93CD4|nr:peptidase [Streptomyces sp. SCSIO ZS0520]
MPFPSRALLAVVVPAAALCAALLPGGAQARTGAPALPSPEKAAATWTASRLTEGTHASGDQGLTADIVMALAATGTGGATAEKATDWLAAHAADYIDRGTPGRVFAGGTAKLALVAAIEHRDPADFGGIDLTATLLGRMQDSGRFTDDLPNGDGSNQFTQSLAVLALQRTGDLPAKAADFLAASRCADGGYPLFFKSDPAQCTSHTDSTGLAVQALLGAGRTADAEAGLDWLEKQQLPDGSFRDNGFGTPPGNTNSTALDVQALAAGKRTAAAAEGTAWLTSRQLGCRAPAADRGAVGYAEPVVDGTTLRATAQAVPALAGKPLAQIDGKDSASALEPIDCAPGDGSTGGSGGTSGGDTGGTSGGGTGGSAGGDSGGDGGTGSGGSGGGSGNSGGTGGSSSSGSPSGTPAPGTVGGGAVTSGGTGGSATGGGLAATGSAALPYAAGSLALLTAGAAAVALTRRGRRSH